jgi:CRISPR/Cas system CMR-associated protein Cmr5 small subunit
MASVNRQEYHARRVYACLQAIQTEDVKLQEKFALLCYKLPFLLRRNGLLKSLEWMRSRFNPNKPDDNVVYVYLLAYLFWCLEDLMKDKNLNKSDYEDPERWPVSLVKIVREASLAEYMMYVNRCFEIGEWFRILAQSELGVPK